MLFRAGPFFVAQKKKKRKEKKRKEKKRKEKKRKEKKTTAPRIPAWSPTVVLTGRHPG
jgi:vacuolar-type H+-ATPase subunit I/STV1